MKHHSSSQQGGALQKSSRNSSRISSSCWCSLALSTSLFSPGNFLIPLSLPQSTLPMWFLLMNRSRPHFHLFYGNWGSFQQWLNETVQWGGKGTPVWGLLPVQFFELWRTHSSWAWLETTSPGHSLTQGTIDHWADCCAKKNDNFRGLKCRDGNPSLNATTRKASRSHKGTKGWAELPDLPSHGIVPSMYMTVFYLWLLGFSFCHSKVCREEEEEQKGLWRVRKG